MDRNICFFIYFIFLMLTARDIFSKWNQSLEKTTSKAAASGVRSALDQRDLLDDEPKKSIPSMSFHSTADLSSGPTITITYCYSCGYEKAFEEYSKILLTKYPNITVLGSNHSPGFLKYRTAQLLLMTKLAVILMLVANIDPFALLGHPTPRLWVWMKEHKINACIMVYFLANTFENVLMSSGAFEVYYNDVQIWSKIQTGRVPTPNELFELINSQHRQYFPSSEDVFGKTLHTIPGRSL